MPLVSIVIPVCNAEKYLAECLDSILNQTLTDIELICVNDGSKDRSGEMLDEYARRDPRVKVIHKVNTGYGHSMNVGFDAAQGEYIGIVESDDWIEQDMYEKLLNAALITNADVVKANFFLYYGEPQPRDEFFEVIPPRLCGRVFRPLDDVDLERVDFWNRKPSIWSAIYRTEFIRKNHIRFHETPGASYQDASFNFKVWACAERVFCLDRALLHYRQDNASSSVNASTSKVYCVRDEYEEMERFIAGRDCDKERLNRIMNRIRFDTYLWNVERLAQPAKKEFADYAAKSFSILMEQGMMDEKLFEPARWRLLNRFVKNPDCLEEQGSSARVKDVLRSVKKLAGRWLRSWNDFYPENGGWKR